MKRYLLTIIAFLIMVSALSFAGCSCNHEYGSWNTKVYVSCVQDGLKERTCIKCNAIESETVNKLPHEFREANCTTPKICSICGSVEGGVSDDHFWLDATCAVPKTCYRCKKTEGDVSNEHVWREATCTEPKTCKVCNATEGEPEPHNWKPATCLTPKICKTCSVSEGEKGDHLWTKATCTDPQKCTRCNKIGDKATGHSYSGGKCKTCGAKDPAAGIGAALKKIERYPRYIEINKDLIANEYDLFNLSGNYSYFVDAHEHILEIAEYLQKVIDIMSPYTEQDYWIKSMVEDSRECILSMPIVPSSTSKSSLRSYISKGKTFANKADRIFVVYENLCEKYGA